MKSSSSDRGRALGAALAGVVLLAAPAAGDDGETLRALVVRRADVAERPLATVVGRGPALVTFWASYCAPCRAEVPVLRAAARRWGRQGLRVVAVAVDLDDAARAARVAREWGIDYESWWLPPAERGPLVGLLPAGLPATFFVGPAGVTRQDRLLTEAGLEKSVPPLLGPPPP